MPKIRKRAPETLQPYLFHGIDLNWQDGDKEALGACPFCGREDKFSVDIRTGQWKCFVCDTTGNAFTFLQKFWVICDKATTNYEELRVDRKLQYPDTLIQWGVVRSTLNNDWLIPGFNAEGKLQQLYRRAFVRERWCCLPTPKVSQSKANKEGHRLHGVNLHDSDNSTIYLCEGPWDGMVLWEMLRQVKQSEDGLSLTANVERSLLNDASVLAVPGCSVFLLSWLPLFACKVVNLMYDNDHPRNHPKTGKTVAPGALTAMKRVAGILSQAKKPPTEINYLRWGEEHGYNTDLPHGYDIRDALNA